MSFTSCSSEEMKMEKNTDEEYSKTPIYKSEISVVRCDLCAASFTDIDSITNHLDSHIDIKAMLVPNEDFSQLLVHKTVHYTEGTFYCNVCCIMTQYGGGKCNCNPKQVCRQTSYKCDVCDAMFSKSSDLKQHEKNHSGAKPYKCDLYDARFSTSSTLKSHQVVHSVEKPYNCDLCAARFSKSFALKTHKRIHSGEKPYKCDICIARFTQSSGLQFHKISHSFSSKLP